MTDKAVTSLYEFGPFRLDVAKRLLMCSEQNVPLKPKAFDLLLALVQRRGEIVTKDDLLQIVWPETVVEEGNLTQHIFLLRKALGQPKDDHSYIVTVPGKGYQFVAEITYVGKDENSVVERQTSDYVAIEPEKDRASDYQPSFIERTPIHIALPPVSKGKFISRKLGLLLVLVAVIVAGAYTLISRNSAAKSNPTVQSIAVLPFTVLGDSSDTYLGEGLSDTLITRLSKSRQIKVRPTSAVLKYNQPSRDISAIGRELQVDSVLSGSIHKVDGRLRVTVQLISVKDGSPIWAEQFDENFTDILAVQDAVSDKVSRALGKEFGDAEKTILAKRYTHSADAYELYLKGRYFWNLREENVTRSIPYFMQAISRDPNFALAYAGLADATGMSDELLPQAEIAAKKAIELDGTLGEPHASLGLIKMFRYWDWDGADQEFRRAIELNPGYATAHHWRATCFEIQGRFKEAEAEFQQALELDPNSLIINSDLGQLYYFEHDYDRGIEQCRKVLSMDPTFSAAHKYLMFLYTRKGLDKEAWHELSLMRGFELQQPPEWSTLYETEGLRGGLRVFLRSLQQHTETSSDYMYSVLAALTGEQDRSLQYLEQAQSKHEFLVPFANVEPAFDELRSTPRFIELRQRLGLAK